MSNNALDLSSAELLHVINTELAPILNIYDMEKQGNCQVSNIANANKSVPEQTPIPLVMQQIAQRAQQGLRLGHPGYLAHVPNGGIPWSAVADLISDLLNRYTGYSFSCPGLLEMEVEAMKWITNMVYGTKYANAFGLLTSGGAMAHFTGLCAAVNFCKKKHGTVDKLVVYINDQTHFSAPKAARICGTSHIRVLKSNDQFQTDIQLLQAQIEQDLQQGLIPAVLIANVGTTNTGAVDDLAACATVCDKYGLWFHGDAAYAGFYLLCESGKQQMPNIDLCDSLVLDPHKSLWLPHGTGCLVVKNKMHLKQTFGGLAHAEYIMQRDDEDAYQSNASEDLSFYDLADMSMEGTRPFRGLRIWLPVKVLGIKRFEQTLEQMFTLCHWAFAELQKIPQIQIITAPSITVFNFRIVMQSSNTDKEIENDCKKVMDHVNGKGRVFINNTKLKGKFVIRVIVNSFRTNMQTMEHLVDDMKEAINNLLQT